MPQSDEEHVAKILDIAEEFLRALTTVGDKATMGFVLIVSKPSADGTTARGGMVSNMYKEPAAEALAETVKRMQDAEYSWPPGRKPN